MLLNATLQKSILLLEINKKEEQKITQWLSKPEYNIQRLKYHEFQKNTPSALPQLIIVDTRDNGCDIIDKVKQRITDRSPNKILSFSPPILALIDTCLKHRERIFHQGAHDYLSCPLISAELDNRVNYAFLSTDINQVNNIDNLEIKPDNYSPLSEIPLNSHLMLTKEHTLAKNTSDYLMTQLENEINLSSLSRKMGTNRNNLSKAFQSCFGIPVFSWLRTKRMSRAAMLLRTSSLSILQVAEQVGYPDSNNFSTAFKREIGISPMKYRKEQTAYYE